MKKKIAIILGVLEREQDFIARVSARTFLTRKQILNAIKAAKRYE